MTFTREELQTIYDSLDICIRSLEDFKKLGGVQSGSDELIRDMEKVREKMARVYWSVPFRQMKA